MKGAEGGAGMTITEADGPALAEAGRIHSVAWQASHRAFCSPAFVALHTPERQQTYLRRKLEAGSRVFLLTADIPAGLVTLSPGDLIEDLYVLPERQNRGYGTALLEFAAGLCGGPPRLWVLDNNAGALRLYRRLGFRPTGKRSPVTDTLDELELIRQ